MLRSLFVILLAFHTVVVSAQDQATGQPAKVDDVAYGKGGEQDLKLNLVLPTGEGPFPAVVFIHGGGWRGGSYKESGMNGIMLSLARQGFICASIQYRLTPSGARYPAQIEDCKCAVRWLRGHAKEYHLDVDRMGAMGASAGGHLALLLGLTTKEDGLEGRGDLQPEFAKLPSNVQAVVNVFGPTDLVNGDWSKDVEPLINDLLGGKIAEKTELAKKASPLTYIQPGRKLPPILTFHGTKDRIVTFIHATRLQEALSKAKADAILVPMEGEDHGWGGEKFQQTIKQAEAFFRQHLQGQN